MISKQGRIDAGTKNTQFHHSTKVPSFIKTVIVWLAMRNLLTAKLAEKAIRILHLEAA